MKWIAVGAAILAAAYTADHGYQLWLVFLLAALLIAVFGPDQPAVSVSHNHFDSDKM